LASAGLSAVLEVEVEARGRPRVPVELQKLIVKMANENPTWGEERIAAELLLKLGIRISPRTVRRYTPPDHGRQRGPSSQRWMTFVQNHAHGILACDFFITVTAGFRVLYVFVIMEVGTRRIAHFNVTAHPSAEWTLQQLREVVTERKCTDSSSTTATAFTPLNSTPR
jgi:putative transposase